MAKQPEPVDAVNRYIHVEIMGKCWHDNSTVDGGAKTCPDCPQEISISPAFYRLAYCSDASPRSLLNEVVAKVIAERSRQEFGMSIYHELEGGYIHSLELTAEQIARACKAAWEARTDV